MPQAERAGTVLQHLFDTVKIFIALTLPFLLLSCELSSTKKETTPPKIDKPAEPEAPEELPAEQADDGLGFVDPDTTGKLLTEEETKTVAGPAPVTVPEPTQDSPIDITPSIPSSED